MAKRLMDYGFHAPTLSFPVPGTLMVEPTESETLQEIDRFIHAMIAIREEIRKVERGEWPQDDNPLKHAPHTAASVMGAEWNRPYSREVGVFPLASLKQSKYWTPIGRVDNVYGDRNLFCSCVPLSDHADGPVGALLPVGLPLYLTGKRTCERLATRIDQPHFADTTRPLSRFRFKRSALKSVVADWSCCPRRITRRTTPAFLAEPSAAFCDSPITLAAKVSQATADGAPRSRMRGSCANNLTGLTSPDKSTKVTTRCFIDHLLRWATHQTATSKRAVVLYANSKLGWCQGVVARLKFG